MNDLQSRGFEPPTQDALEHALLDYIMERLSHLLFAEVHGGASGYERWAYLAGSTDERVAHDAAAAALDSWMPAWIEGRRQAGRVGGQRSKRGPIWNESDLSVLEILDGMTVAEQAGFFGKSKSTVERMRVALRQQSTATPPAEHEVSIAEDADQCVSHIEKQVQSADGIFT